MHPESASKTLSPPPDFVSPSAGTFGERIEAAGGSLHAEAGLIASLVADAERVFRVVDGCRIQLHHLVDPRAQTILAACQELRAGKYGDGGVDIITLADHLRRNGESGSAMAWLESNLQSSITAHAESYAASILEDYQRRTVTAALGQALQRIGTDDPGAVLERLRNLEITTDGGNGLPSIVSGSDFVASESATPPEVIRGVLHAGSKGIFGGPSKAFKTWNLLDLCISVAEGAPWLGFETAQGRALYINFELQEFALHKRLLAIAEAKALHIGKNLDVWNLRGHSRPLTELLPELKRQVRGEGYSVIVPDPIYKTLQGRNENDAGDIGEVCSELEAVAVETGAAVFFGAHFAKGNASGKESIDRISGSGVWARDPDAIVVATPHEEEGAFTVQMTLRNFAQPDPFCIKWQYPLMMRAEELDPERLKQSAGRKATHDISAILTYLNGEELTTAEWGKRAQTEGGLSRATFYRLRAEAEKKKRIRLSKISGKWTVAA